MPASLARLSCDCITPFESFRRCLRHCRRRSGASSSYVCVYPDRASHSHLILRYGASGASKPIIGIFAVAITNTGLSAAYRDGIPEFGTDIHGITRTSESQRSLETAAADSKGRVVQHQPDS
jgi:hypothetical protein